MKHFSKTVFIQNQDQSKISFQIVDKSTYLIVYLDLLKSGTQIQSPTELQWHICVTCIPSDSNNKLQQSNNVSSPHWNLIKLWHLNHPASTWLYNVFIDAYREHFVLHRHSRIHVTLEEIQFKSHSDVNIYFEEE